jgi:isopentenyl-diphosphate Delta-isomerase
MAEKKSKKKKELSPMEKLLEKHMKSLEITLKEDIQYHGYDYFEDIFLVQNSLTQISIDEVDLSTEFLGKKLKYPIFIAGLTGGMQKLQTINKALADFAKKYSICMGIGDQTFGLKLKDNSISYVITRQINQEGLIIANLSAKYLLNSKDPVGDVKAAIEMIKADAIEIYVDPLRDLLWNEKKTGFSGLFEILKDVLEATPQPILFKNLNTGLSNEDVRFLWDIGISAINLSGVGGTSFARMETYKTLTLSQKQSDFPIIKPFDFWGIPTLWSLIDVACRPENKDIPVISGGGIRNGIQAVKALALGADLISIGHPILEELTEDFGYPQEKNLERWFDYFIREMKMTMCLLGVKDIKSLREVIRNRVIIFGKTKEWICSRGIDFPPNMEKKCK